MFEKIEGSDYILDKNFKYMVNTVKSLSWVESRDDKGEYGIWPTYSIKNWYEGYINS